MLNPVYCHACRREIDAHAAFCPHCGADQRPPHLRPSASAGQGQGESLASYLSAMYKDGLDYVTRARRCANLMEASCNAMIAFALFSGAYAGMAFQIGNMLEDISAALSVLCTDLEQVRESVARIEVDVTEGVT